MLRRAGAGREERLAGVWRTVLILHDRARALEAEVSLIAGAKCIAPVALPGALCYGTAIQVAECFLLSRGNLVEAGRLAVGVAASGAAVEGAEAALRVGGRRGSRRAAGAGVA